MLKGLILFLGFVLLFASVVFVGIGEAALEVIAFCAMSFSALLLVWIAFRNEGASANSATALKIRSRRQSSASARRIARSEPVAR